MYFLTAYRCLAGLFFVLMAMTFFFPPAGTELESGPSVLLFLGFLLFLGDMFVRFILEIVGGFFPKVWRTTSEIPLLTLRNTEGVTGSFFLGSGSISDRGVYVYYVPTGDGGYTQQRMGTDWATVYEEDRTDGILRTEWREFAKPWYKRIARFRRESWLDKRFSFHIPKGALKLGFELR